MICSPETIQEVVKPSDLSESRLRLETLLTFPKRYIREKKEIFAESSLLHSPFFIIVLQLSI